MNVRDLGACTWQDVAAATRPLLLAVPVGALEQHGPHLPLDTDTRIATALTAGLAARRADVVAAPAVPYGSSGEHSGFPGTVSIGQEAVEILIVELGRCLGRPFAGLILVQGHGGNAEPVDRAVTRLTAEGRTVLAWSPYVPGGDAHAGRTETSLLLALAPDLVRARLAAAGETRPLTDLLDHLKRGGVRRVSPNGVLGDPTGASAEEGRRLLATLTEHLCAAVAAWSAAAG